jgi:DNA-binding PucR family transcriptional regulator
LAHRAGEHLRARATLDVHPNTVRRRLDRFEEATGRSLRETETVVEVWWAVQRRRLV